MLYLLSGAQPDIFSAVVGPVLRASKTPHRLVSVTTGIPVLAENDVLLALGSKALDLLIENNILPQGRKVGGLRGKRLPLLGGKASLYVTYDPGIVQIEWERKPEVIWDVNLAIRVAETGKEDPVLGDYRFVEDFSDVIAAVEDEFSKTGKPVPISADLETVGLDPIPEDVWIVSLSLTYKDGQADVRYFDGVHDQPKKGSALWKQIHFLMNSPKVRVRGANFKFDMLWMRRKWGVPVDSYVFDTTLVGSILDENRSNSLNMHTKTYAKELGGYDDCVSPETLLCTDDLRWVEAGDLQVNDGLLGFDEEPPAYKHPRRLRRSRVVSTKRLTKPGLKIKFSTGVEIKCSADHGFLACRTGDKYPLKWVRAFDLSVGQRVNTALDKEEHVTTWLGGWLSGVYDGEGYVSYKGAGTTSGISQKPGLVWDQYCAGMKSLGLGGFYSRQRNGGGVHTSKQYGAATLRMLQMLRPVRLLSKYGYVNKCLPSGTRRAYVASIEPIGDIEVVSIETDTHTFVAEGLCSHNSFNNKYDKSRMDLVPKADLLAYSGGDTAAVYRVSEVLKAELLRDRKLTNFYTKILHPAGRVLEDVEYRGVCVDRQKYADLEVEVKGEIKRLETEIFGIMPRKLRLKYADNLSLTRDVILREFMFSPSGLNLKPQLFTAKKKEPSCTLEHFERFEDVPEAKLFVEKMGEYNSASKTLTTYIIGFLKHLRADGRFHPNYIMFKGDVGGEESGTVTGRLSARDPAVQTWPKHTKWAKPLRRVVVPPPGMAILCFDFAQGELKITACVANETTMIAAYKQGVDLHSVTAAEVKGMPFDRFMALPEEERELLRFFGKAGNFGKIYGMGVLGFVAYARKQYGVLLTNEQSQEFHDRFFKLYPQLLEWHKLYKNMARSWGYVRSPLGRIRHLPLIKSRNDEVRSKAERVAINSPIQSTLSDLMLWCLIELKRRWPELWVFGVTHDEGAMYVPEDEVALWAERVKEVAENLPIERDFGWSPQLTFTVDVETGSTLGDKKKYKKS